MYSTVGVPIREVLYYRLMLVLRKVVLTNVVVVFIKIIHTHGKFRFPRVIYAIYEKYNSLSLKFPDIITFLMSVKLYILTTNKNWATIPVFSK